MPRLVKRVLLFTAEHGAQPMNVSMRSLTETFHMIRMQGVLTMIMAKDILAVPMAEIALRTVANTEGAFRKLSDRIYKCWDVN